LPAKPADFLKNTPSRGIPFPWLPRRAHFSASAAQLPVLEQQGRAQDDRKLARWPGHDVTLSVRAFSQQGALFCCKTLLDPSPLHSQVPILCYDRLAGGRRSGRPGQCSLSSSALQSIVTLKRLASTMDISQEL